MLAALCLSVYLKTLDLRMRGSISGNKSGQLGPLLGFDAK
jgi:hypothetical protein